MKPFNIEEAKKNPKLVVYRDGIKPVEVLFLEKADISANIITVKPSGGIFTHYKSGSFHAEKESHLDLFLIEQPEEQLFIIIDNKNQWDGTFYTDLKLAERMELPFDTIYKLTKI